MLVDDLVAHLPKGGDVYIKFDIDDLAIAPGTGTPQPGGFSYYEAKEILLAVCARCNVVGMDLVEVAPQYDGRGQVTALHCVRLILDHGGRRFCRARRSSSAAAGSAASITERSNGSATWSSTSASCSQSRLVSGHRQPQARRSPRSRSPDAFSVGVMPVMEKIAAGCAETGATPTGSFVPWGWLVSGGLARAGHGGIYVRGRGLRIVHSITRRW